MATLTGLRCSKDGAVFTAIDGSPLVINVTTRADRPPKAQQYKVGQHQHLVFDPADVAQCPTCGDRWRFVGTDEQQFTKTRQGT